MQKTYQCKDCSSQISSLMRPSECENCGGREWNVLDSARPQAPFQFRSLIEGYCRNIGWNIHTIEDEIAVIKFDMESERTQTVLICKYGSTLEFSCPSSLGFDDLEDVNHVLSTALLQKNSEYKLGFWCLQKLGKKYFFSLVCNAEISLINVTHFRRLVNWLIDECESFDQAVNS